MTLGGSWPRPDGIGFGAIAAARVDRVVRGRFRRPCTSTRRSPRHRDVACCSPTCRGLLRSRGARTAEAVAPDAWCLPSASCADDDRVRRAVFAGLSSRPRISRSSTSAYDSRTTEAAAARARAALGLGRSERRPRSAPRSPSASPSASGVTPGPGLLAGDPSATAATASHRVFADTVKPSPHGSRAPARPARRWIAAPRASGWGGPGVT